VRDFADVVYQVRDGQIVERMAGWYRQ
jgi:hypothetical protein